MNQMSNVKGYSIIELLIVVSIFSVIILLSTQAIVLSLRSSRKGESLITVRENIDYAFGVMERHIRSAGSIESCSPVQINYTDRWGKPAIFSCIGGTSGYIASGSATLLRITSDEVEINCNSVEPIFTCPIPSGDAPPSVEIKVTGVKADESAIEGARVTSSTKILLRTY